MSKRLTDKQKHVDKFMRSETKRLSRERAKSLELLGTLRWEAEFSIRSGSADGNCIVIDADSDSGDLVAIIDPDEIYDATTSDAFARLMAASPKLLRDSKALVAVCEHYIAKQDPLFRPVMGELAHTIEEAEGAA